MGKEKGQREKWNKKITARKLIGVLIILAGIGVFCYPLCVQAYNAYEQKKMIEELRENIATAQDAIAAMEERKDFNSSETIDPPGSTESAKSLELPAGTGFPVVAEQGQIDAVQDGGQENQADDFEGTSKESQEEIPKEGTQEEETKPDRLNGKKVIGIIEIEAISLIYPIVEGAETEDIGVAIGHMSDTAELGAIGNCALAGHRGGYSGPYFKKLDELKAGDEVVITNAQGKEFIYKVTESMTVEPTDVWVIEDTGESKALLTLITCEENGDKRLIVRCELVP